MTLAIHVMASYWLPASNPQGSIRKAPPSKKAERFDKLRMTNYNRDAYHRYIDAKTMVIKPNECLDNARKITQQGSRSSCSH